MSQLIHSASRLPINMAHVRQQFARRGTLEDARFFYDEIATRMIDRLGYIKVAPERIVDAGCGPGNSLYLLAARYPQASIIGVDHCAPFIEHCASLAKDEGETEFFFCAGRYGCDAHGARVGRYGVVQSGPALASATA